MKKISILIFLMLPASLVIAQSINVNGNVRSNQGNPLHFAFVQDKQTKAATYTDISGNFTLTANPSSLLGISCAGFRDTVIDVINKSTLLIVLNLSSAKKKYRRKHRVQILIKIHSVI